MWSFFHGWQRKVGVVTLVMALAVTGMWARSFMILDQVRLYRKDVFRVLVTTPGSFGWIDHTDLSASSFKPPPPSWSWGYLHVGDTHPDPATHLITWQIHVLGFGVGKGVFNNTDVVLIPYWPFAIPLTLLSAHLILWKPRKRETSAPPTNLNLISN
ncbi:MAG: hypothetical protein JWP89_1572 [Schlesneria sp.]|nr:hypothetical protein [Schlesneria sp.]